MRALFIIAGVVIAVIIAVLVFAIVHAYSPDFTSTQLPTI